MRSRLDEQIDVLNAEMIKMGEYCENAIEMAIRAMIEDDKSYIEKVLKVDAEIDQKERDIENLCMKLLLQHHPVARDLRQISAALKMISDMERIGDQAADIAEIIPYIIGKDTMSETHIGQMAREVIKMVNDSIESYVKKDLDLAKKVIDHDDIVDKYFMEIKTELIKLVADDSNNGEYYIDLLMITKYLERIGDHATNLAEWVEFCITGIHTSYE